MPQSPIDPPVDDHQPADCPCAGRRGCPRAGSRRRAHRPGGVSRRSSAATCSSVAGTSVSRGPVIVCRVNSLMQFFSNISSKPRYGLCMTMTTFQPSLLDAVTEVGPSLLGDGTRRTTLSHGAWVDLHPGWLHGADELYERLLTGVPWHAERRPMYDRVVDVPRLLKFYGEGEPLPDPVLVEVRDALDDLLRRRAGRAVPYGRVVPLPRRPRQRRLARRHVRPRLAHDTMVAIVSVGSPRALLLRPKGAAGGLRYEVGHGDLSSWAAAASGRGSTPCPRPRGRWGRASHIRSSSWPRGVTLETRRLMRTPSPTRRPSATSTEPHTASSVRRTRRLLNHRLARLTALARPR